MKKNLFTIKNIGITAFIALAILSFVFVVDKAAQAAFNSQINYQGKLTDTTNQAVADGSYNLRFRLCITDDCSDVSDPVWTETHCYSADDGATCTGAGVDQRASITSGLFSTLLGSINSLSSIDFNQTLYLETQVGGAGATPVWETLTPRKKLGAVPAAFTADKLDGIDSTSFLRSDEADSMTASSTDAILTVRQDGSGKIVDFKAGANSALAIDGSGDLTFGSGGMFYDYSTSRLGLGTIIPSTNLDIVFTGGTSTAESVTYPMRFSSGGGTNPGFIAERADVNRQVSLLTGSSGAVLMYNDTLNSFTIGTQPWRSRYSTGIQGIRNMIAKPNGGTWFGQQSATVNTTNTLEVKGLNLILPYVQTGTGLSDVTFGGTFTGTASETFTVEIDSAGATDTFKWKKGSGAYTTGVAMTGAAQTLSDGITVTFTATTGHTLGDKWVTDITVADPFGIQTNAGNRFLNADNNGRVIVGDINPTSSILAPIPTSKITSFGGPIESVNSDTLGAESLANTAMTGGTSWTATGDMAYNSNNFKYIHSTGSGTLTQASSSFATPIVANRWYKLTYSITSATSGTTATLSTSIASMATSLLTTVNTSKTIYFKAAAVPGDFVINITSTGGGFTIDNISLMEIQNGNIIANGLFTGGGTSGIKVLANGYVGIGTTTPGALLDVQGAAQFGSGDVNLIDSTGKIAILNATTLASSTGAYFTDLNATNISSGTLALARGGTGLGTVASGSILAANALDTLSAITSTSGLKVLQNNAGTISWITTTGTGNAVYDTSPTIATPTFTTSIVAPIVYGSTSANGTLTLQGNSASSGNTLTNANMSFKVGDSGATTAMTILNNGNVGIGTTTPAGTLHVAGSATGSNWLGLFAENGITPEDSSRIPTNQNKAISVQGNGAAYFMGRDVTNDIEFIMGTSASGLTFAGSMTANDFQLRTNNSAKLTIQNSNGNVGIGTTTPGARLQVVDITEQLRLGYDSANYNSFTVGATGSLNIAAVGTNPNITLTPGGTGYTILNGNVGIGTTTPVLPLDILGGGSAASQIRIGNSDINNSNKNGKIVSRHYVNTEEDVLGLQLYNTSSDNSVRIGGGSDAQNAATLIEFYTASDNVTLAGTTRMVISSAGSVGIGTTTPGALLDVQGAAQFGSGDVNLIDSTGKIAILNATTLASSTGAYFTDLNATNISSGTLALARGGTGLGTVASGSILAANALDTLSAITSTSGLKVLQNNAGTISWITTTGTGNAVYDTSPTIATPTFTTSIVAPIVYGSTSADGVLTLQGNSATTGNTLTNANMSFKVGDSGATTAMTILNNGNVGIGTTSPAFKLQVHNDAAAAGYIKMLSTDTAGISVIEAANIDGGYAQNVIYGSAVTGTRFGLNKAGMTAMIGSGSSVVYGNALNNPVVFIENNLEKMRLTGGNFGIGTTTPGARLHSLSTTEQLRLGYDASNYNSFTVGATGSLNIAAVGTNPNITLTPGGTGYTILNGNVGIGTTAPSYKFVVKGTATTDQPTLGSEFLSASGWTSTDWTGDFATGWTHTAGNTSVLSQSTAAVASTKYQIAYTVTNRTAGSFTIDFGGASRSVITSTATWGPTASSTASLAITPTSDFDGTIIISIKAITAVSSPIATFNSSDGTARLTFRANSAGDNVFMGPNAGSYTTTGIDNSAFGFGSLAYNTTGNYNTAIGKNAMYHNTYGAYNVALGVTALLSNTSGYQNTAIGPQALYSNTSGYYNIALGQSAMYSNTTGTRNVAIGHSAGRYQADGSTPLQITANSIYIGANAMGYNDSDNNSIVIGYNAQGIGANTVVLGNDSILTTALKGNVGIGTTTPGARLHSLSTTEQLRLGYDASNYNSFTVGATGSLNIAAVGTNPNITLTPGGTGYTILNGNVGIGAISPDAFLTASKNVSSTPGALPSGTYLHFVQADATAGRMLMDAFGNQNIISMRRANGAAASPTAVVADDILGSIGGFGYGATSYAGSNRASISFAAEENWTDSAYGSYMSFITTAAGGVTATEKMRLTSTGNLGIGTTTPASKLHIISGDIQLGTVDTAGNKYLRLEGQTNPELGIKFREVSQNYGFDVMYDGDNSNNLHFVGHNNDATGVVHMSINRDTGYVGIGTTTPGALLDVQGAAQFGTGDVNLIDSTGKIAILNATTLASSTGAYFTDLNATNISSGTLALARGGTGLGTIAAGSILAANSLDVLSAITSTSDLKVLQNNAGTISWITTTGTGNAVYDTSPTIATPTFTTSIVAPIVYGSTSANGTLTLQGNNTTGNTATNANLIFKVGDSGNTTAMTILNNGNVGIGITAPLSGLHVSKSNLIVNTRGNLFIGTTDAVSADLGGSLGFGGSYTGTTQTYWAQIAGRKENATEGNYSGYLQFSTRLNGGSNIEQMRITSGGNVGIGTTTPGALLDVQGGVQFGSGDVDLINPAGQIAVLNATTLASSTGAYFTDLNATNISTGTLALARGGTGLGTIAAGSILAANSADTLSAITSASDLKVLQNNNGTISWATTTGTGNIVYSDSPTLVAPVLGAATATTINGLAITANGTNTLNIAAGKTLAVNQSITLTGTDGQTYTFPTTSATLARTDAANTFTGHQTIEGVTSTGATGTGKFVFDTSPTIATPTFTTSIVAPIVYGSTSANGTLTLQGNNTTGNTATNANLIFKVGDSGDTTAMTILNNGNVGIGTGAPTAKLHVSGNSGDTSSYGILRFVTNTGDNDVGIKLGGVAGVSGYNFIQGILGSNNNGIIALNPSGGNVGIGTTTPGAKLDVSGGDIILDNDRYISWRNSTGAKRDILRLDSSNKLNLTNPTGNYVNINNSLYAGLSNNKVGIGTTTPDSSLHIYGSGDLLKIASSTGNMLTVNEAISTFYNPVSFAAAGDISVSYDMILTNSTAGALKFYGPGYIETESSWQNLDLTLRAAGTGEVIVDDILQVTNKIAIGATSSSALLEIYKSDATSTDVMLRVSSSTGTGFKVMGNGEAISDLAFNSGGADYAEYFYTDDLDLASGEVVCIDVEKENAVKRCERGADGDVMGIVSSKPSIIGNSIEKYRNNPNYKIIGMLGQISAKASAENGEIRPGDSLTSASSTAGYIMRAGAGDPTVGIALEKLDAGTGDIKVLISRRNKSMTVEEVEDKITDRIANMEIEDEVNILISDAVAKLDLKDEINNNIDPKMLLLESKLTVKTDDITGQIFNLNGSIAILAGQINQLLANQSLFDQYLNNLKNQVSALNNNGLLAMDENGEIKIGSESVSKVEVVADSGEEKSAFVVNQLGDGQLADFQYMGVSVMNIEKSGRVSVVGDMLVDGRIMVCSGGACGASLDNSVDNTMGDMGVEGKIVAGAFQSYCEDGFVWVTGSSKYGTMPGFCVMQGEARSAGANAEISLENIVNQNNPLSLSISQGDAQYACQSIGDNYHLITENEWLTIAENILRNQENDADAASDGIQLDPSALTFKLLDGSEIKALANGSAEWTDMTITAAGRPQVQGEANDWQEYAKVYDYRGLNINPPYYMSNANNNIGRIKVGDSAGLVGFVRGENGIYSLDLTHKPNEESGEIGFRCAK